MQRKKLAWLWATGAPTILGFPYNISATAEARLEASNLVRNWDLPSTIIKSHAEEKWGVALDLGSSLLFGGSPSIFTQ